MSKRVAKRAKIWFNKEMSINSDTRLVEASTSEREVEFLRRLVEEQRKLIEKLNKQLLNQKERIEQLEAELLAKKKLKGKPKLSASLLNQADVKEAKAEKRRVLNEYIFNLEQ